MNLLLFTTVRIILLSNWSKYSTYLIKWEFDKMGLLEFSGEELTHTFLSENGNSIKCEFLVSSIDL